MEITIPKIAEYFPSIIIAWYRYLKEKENLLEFAKVDVLSFGDEDQTPYIVFKDGLKIYGHPANKTQQAIYKYWLPKSLKSKFHKNAISIAIDYRKRFLPPVNNGHRFDNVKKGDFVIEAGAYTGYYALWLSKEVGETGKVIVIEPIPDNASIIKKHIKGNNIKNIILVEKALSNKKTIIKIFRGNMNKMGGSIAKGLVPSINNYFSIKADSLDSILNDIHISKVNAIRLSIMGAEPEALLGMRNTFKNHKPKLLVSNYANLKLGELSYFEKVKQILKDFNYKVKLNGSSIKGNSIN